MSGRYLTVCYFLFISYSPFCLLQSALKDNEFSKLARNHFNESNIGDNSLEEQPDTPCQIDFLSHEIIVNCSGRTLTNVDNSWFPQDTTVILLNNNFLRVIQNSTFKDLSKMQILDISYNKIDTIASNAFIDLISLERLYIQFNKIDLYSISQYLFCSLTSLQELRLIQGLDYEIKYRSDNRNTGRLGYYPNNIFGCFYNLSTLTVDTMGGTLHFDEEFRNLTKLTHLGLQGSVDYITNSSFTNVVQVKSLSYSNATMINSFDDMALSAFEGLKSISLVSVSMRFHQALNLLKPLVNTNMTSIAMIDIELKKKEKSYIITSGEGVLQKNVTKYLTSICVKHVALMRNNIYVIEPDALTSELWFKCLQHLDLSGNKILGSALSFYYVSRYINVVSFTLGMHTNNYINYNPILMDGQDPLLVEPTDVFKLDDGIYEKSELLLEMIEHRSENKSMQKGSNLIWFLPPSLKYFDASGIFTFLEFDLFIDIRNGHNLEYLAFTNSGLRLVHGPIIGLTSLKILMVSNNRFFDISASFFDTFPTVQHLEMANCLLLDQFMALNSERLYRNLQELLFLDLSKNSLTLLAKNTFVKNTNLSNLNLAGNHFNYIPFDLRNTQKLKFLDIRENTLLNIIEDERDVLDELVLRNGQLELLISENLISCVCQNLGLLQWFQNSYITFDNNGNITCINKDLIISNTAEYKDLDGFWRECWGEFFFYISIVLLCIIIVGFLLFFIISKHIIAIKSYILLKCTGFKAKTVTDYRIGVLICCQEERELLRFAEIHLQPMLQITAQTLLENTMGQAGHDRASEIVEAIQSSWRVLLVFDDGFTDDQWLMLSAKMAVHCTTPENPGRLMILTSTRNQNLIPPLWLGVIPEDNIITVLQWELDRLLIHNLLSRV